MCCLSKLTILYMFVQIVRLCDRTVKGGLSCVYVKSVQFCTGLYRFVQVTSGLLMQCTCNNASEFTSL